jgi:RimJ/RimL family protein N-acetyltransferase
MSTPGRVKNQGAHKPTLADSSEVFERIASFRNRGTIFFRPIRPDDAARLTDLFRSHSAQTVFYRYFSHLRNLSPEQVEKFVNPDYKNDAAIVGLEPEGRQRMLCVGRYFRDSVTNTAEIAITVHDDYQQHGIGTFLLHALIEIAGKHHIAGLTADVLADNHGMMRLLRSCAGQLGLKLQTDLQAGVYHVSFALPPVAP